MVKSTPIACNQTTANKSEGEICYLWEQKYLELMSLILQKYTSQKPLNRHAKKEAKQTFQKGFLLSVTQATISFLRLEGQMSLNEPFGISSTKALSDLQR